MKASLVVVHPTNLHTTGGSAVTPNKNDANDPIIITFMRFVRHIWAVGDRLPKIRAEPQPVDGSVHPKTDVRVIGCML
jgi:hypothetical protein